MKYTVLSTPDPKTDMHPIQLDEGPFAGIQVVFGYVAFDEEQDTLAPILKFDYEVVNDYNVNEAQREDLQNALGDILVQIIEESLSKEETIYKGGE